MHKNYQSNMANVVPKVLTDICEFLSSNQELTLSNATQDGRINSALNENEILNFIESRYNFNDGYSLKRPNAREWYDLVIENEDTKEFYPINIKVTDTTHADNLNCKLGIYYALTGIKPSFGNEISWLPYFQNLSKNFAHQEDKDYFFLIVNKRNSSDIFCATLKGLNTLTPNGNNLPFQCRWDKNRKVLNRNFADAAKMILGTLGESIKLRSDIYFNFKKYFPQYV